jgi:CDP-4-dehydro-6-deoxyglucose reductase
MHPISTSHGRQFEARPNEPLLDAALRQGIALSHSCRTGRCSSCKARVLSGETLALHDELGLNASDRAQGFVLTCVRQAQGPVILDVEDLGDVVLPEVKTLPCRIQSIAHLAPDVVHVVLRLPPASAFHFLPGQYVDLIGEGGVRRSYSIANAPRSDRLLEFHIRKVPNGAMSAYWFDKAKVNDLLRLKGPVGTFFLRQIKGKSLILLATGTGIAPAKAILEGLARVSEAGQPASISLYWGGRHPHDLYWQPPAMDRLKYVPVLSRADASWPGARGHVQDILLSDSPQLVNCVVYACGSEAMTTSAKARLCAAGLATSQFHSDAFVCSATP